MFHQTHMIIKETTRSNRKIESLALLLKSAGDSSDFVANYVVSELYKRQYLT